MGDKEPRRRKKRRDSQKKDDIRSDDQHFTSVKSEIRDSDQEIEEEIITSSHQPSNVAKFVFVILFSGLVISLSFIFISLRGVDRGPVDIFDESHEDHAEIETLHDEHVEDAHHGHDDHEEVSLGDIFPDIGSILSFNNEQIKETESLVKERFVPFSENSQEDEKSESEGLQSDNLRETESLTDQGILEEYIEDLYTPLDEPASSEIYKDIVTGSPYSEEETSQSSYHFSESEEFITASMPEDIEPTYEPFSDSAKSASVFDDEPDDIPTAFDKNVFEADSEDDIEDNFPLYEQADITNEADFEIRDHLDEINSVIGKEFDDEDDDDEEEDEDDYDEDDNIGEEFDFWQF